MLGLEKHILSIAKDIDKPITNLQLQKIWYFTLGFLIKNDEAKLAKKEFENSSLEAWLYGPVVPKFYSEYREYKSMPIQENGRKVEEFNKDDINSFIEKLIKINPFTLVDMSHQHKFWSDNKKEIESMGYRPAYRFKDIEEAFNEKAE